MAHQELRIESGGKLCAMGAIIVLPGVDGEKRIDIALEGISYYFTTAGYPKSAYIRRLVILVAYRDLEKSMNRLDQAGLEVTNGASVPQGC